MYFKVSSIKVMSPLISCVFSTVKSLSNHLRLICAHIRFGRVTRDIGKTNVVVDDGDHTNLIIENVMKEKITRTQ